VVAMPLHIFVKKMGMPLNVTSVPMTRLASSVLS
jgi:hypothetical protein